MFLMTNSEEFSLVNFSTIFWYSFKMIKIAEKLIMYYATDSIKIRACISIVREIVFSSRCASDVAIKRIRTSANYF